MLRGELGRADRLRVVLQAAAIQTRALPSQLAGVAKSGPAAPPLFDPPDSALAREALEHAREVLSPAILAHSLRCWQWAMRFRAVDGLEPDPEALFVACVLHDTALGAPADAHVGCFALLGAEEARRFVAARGAPASAETVATAIVRHMDPRTPTGHGPEAALLHDAAHLDVAGYRVRDLPPEVLRTVIAALPRDGLGAEFGALARHESRVRPRSTMAVLWRGGMRIPLRLNPLDRLGDH
ncbi:HD domain-containing protein [Rhodococcus maanshanensis]|uniref:HD domain-containing protein n=1 Tax=Rhodococcus maanshanensis TaxID=183556 RepID=A0A1H7HE68_9NOCA|nr:HD domain-containing protein [Rhodococcus maanshanensis]SEK46525.1 HD domain-containing protein [Rhodococcus maanshanensis]